MELWRSMNIQLFMDIHILIFVTAQLQLTILAIWNSSHGYPLFKLDRPTITHTGTDTQTYMHACVHTRIHTHAHTHTTTGYIFWDWTILWINASTITISMSLAVIQHVYHVWNRSNQILLWIFGSLGNHVTRLVWDGFKIIWLREIHPLESPYGYIVIYLPAMDSCCIVYTCNLGKPSYSVSLILLLWLPAIMEYVSSRKCEQGQRCGYSIRHHARCPELKSWNNNRHVTRTGKFPTGIFLICHYKQPPMADANQYINTIY